MPLIRINIVGMMSRVATICISIILLLSNSACHNRTRDTQTYISLPKDHDLAQCIYDSMCVFSRSQGLNLTTNESYEMEYLSDIQNQLSVLGKIESPKEHFPISTEFQQMIATMGCTFSLTINATQYDILQTTIPSAYIKELQDQGRLTILEKHPKDHSIETQNIGASEIRKFETALDLLISLQLNQTTKTFTLSDIPAVVYLQATEQP